ncbi:PREDICTED: phospholipid scramblase 2-like [Miniopterus natalensis]|uniref:phospholipid scramblase 2-like n=1 Tax=Miniopterus natalensis TaxID=291302 RepID=UPI0007A6CFF2|nr:PREDICTED: phospholipid scramblase 2-like [Miniopterus natalensis]
MDDQRCPEYSGQPGLQDASPGLKTDYKVPPPGYSGAGSVRFPVQHQPVHKQPGGPARGPWVPAPPLPSDCPPGLECLNQVNEVLVHQQIDLLEVIIHIETNNKYEIKNRLGQKIYFVMEDTGCCTRNCCGGYRPFSMRILDLMGREVITMEKPLKCDCCCCSCCLHQVEIYAPPGTPIGYVIQTRHPYLPKFTIQNENKKDILRIIGPFFACKCCGDVDFEIKSLDEENVVGKISKQWTGFVREAFTDYSDFDIQFPVDLDVKMKAVMLGACFLIMLLYCVYKYSHAPHNISVNNGPDIRQCSYKIIMELKNSCCLMTS